MSGPGLILLLAAPLTLQEPVSFQREVQPLLRARCAGCHQPAKRKGKLDLTTHASLLAGGHDEGVVVPGDVAASLLIEMVSPQGDEAPEMPSEGPPLSAAERDLLARWIREGAEDDGGSHGPRYDAQHPPVYPRPPIVTDLAFSPDGSLLAVTGRHEVLLHAADGSGLITRLIGLSERLESVAFSPDGAKLAVAGGTPALSGELQVWDVTKRELELSVAAAHDTLYGASWSHDGAHIAFGGPDKTLRAIDARTGEQVLFQLSHEDRVLDTAWSTDSSHLVSVSRDRSMKLVQVTTQQFIDNITSITPGALKGGLMCVERHPTRDELLVGGADGAPKVFRMYREKKRVIGDDYNLIRAFEPMTGRTYAVTWSPDGERVAAASSHVGGGQVRVYTAADGATLWTRSLPAGVYAVAFHPGGELLAAAGFDGRVYLLQADDGVLRSRFDAAPLTETTR